MDHVRRRCAAALLAAAALALAPAPARSEEPPPPAAAEEGAPAKPAATPKQEKIRRFLELTRWKEQLLAELDSGFDAQAKLGKLPRNFAKKFAEVADFEALRDRVVEVWDGLVDEETLDGAIAFLSTEAGRKLAAAQVQVPGALKDKVLPWAMEQGMKTMQAIMGETAKEGEEEDGEKEEWGPLASLREAKRSANETAAIATLRNLASCQAQIQTSGKIDCDQDGIGEYGTFLELTGTVPVRTAEVTVAGETGLEHGSDFSATGTKVRPAILSPALRAVDARGVVVKNGYCYRIYLPDSAPVAGFVHEKGPAAEVGLDGGTGRIATDFAETVWCAYAWPVKRGDTGNRAFFVNQAGDVIQSKNGKAQWEGEKGPPGFAAFLGAGITSEAAVGTTGRDGEVWEPTW